MPVPTWEGQGSLEWLSGRTFGQGDVPFDDSAYQMYGADPDALERARLQEGLGAAQGAAQQARAAMQQFEATERDWIARQGGEVFAGPGMAMAEETLRKAGGNINNVPAFQREAVEKLVKYKQLQDAAKAAEEKYQTTRTTTAEQEKKFGPSKFDAEMERMKALSEEKGKTFEDLAGPYLSALEKSKGQMQGATDLYKTAAEGKGPSAAQSQYQSALDQAARQQMGAAGSMRGGALNQISAQRDAALMAGQQEAQAAAGSASLRAQEMQAAMAGYGDMTSKLGALDQGTAQMAAQTGTALEGQNNQQQQFYENLRQGGYQNQATLRQQAQAAKEAEKWKERTWDMAMSQAQHQRSNEGWQNAVAIGQGILGSATQIGAAGMKGKG